MYLRLYSSVSTSLWLHLCVLCGRQFGFQGSPSKFCLLFFAKLPHDGAATIIRLVCAGQCQCDRQSIFKIHTQANTKKIARSPDIIKRFPSGKLISQFQTTIVSVRYATATVEDTDTDAMHWTARSNEVFFDSNTSSSSAALFLWLMMMMRKMMQRI